MSLKRIPVPNTTILDLLEAESYSFTEKKLMAWYIVVAQAFGVNPSGCSEKRYLLARSTASQIWDIWVSQASDLQIDDNDYLVILKAASMFEITNFLISSNLETGSIIKRNPKEKWDWNYNLRTVPKKSETLLKLKNQLSAINRLLNDLELPTKLHKELTDYKDDIQPIFETISKNEFLIFQGNGFKYQKISKKTRIHEYLVNALMFNLTEILHRVITQANKKQLKYIHAQSIVLRFINSFIDPNNRSSSAHKITAEALNQRLKAHKKNYRGREAFNTAFENALKKLI